MAELASVRWPEKYLPGLTDNFASNEIVVQGLTDQDVWPLITDTSKWAEYYDNVGNITFPDGDNGPHLRANMNFKFGTFGFPSIDARVIDFQPPTENRGGSSDVGRISWTAKQLPELDVMHAWLFENLPQDRVRILTQESQLGSAAVKLAKQKPNPMINGHQDWLEGLRDYALQKKE
ncbi:hypothetical protein BDB00DRAFT_757603 [Zychaea mexicana]|uniref:uncharacterized protein n=1 Tax=Zychaea mexicana TaxID=64656 RepID=UPI0022FE9047|nr:uncharacterized protein BDB00DRAFT_757603 [Zychaea mexicana]KAI9496790.1 hypothetical protein BDB00DRAFT_757603 [Zychaea mexicana]